MQLKNTHNGKGLQLRLIYMYTCTYNHICTYMYMYNVYAHLVTLIFTSKRV